MNYSRTAFRSADQRSITKKPIWLIVLLPLMIILGCSQVDEPVSPELPHLKVFFDGDICQVTGHDSGQIRGLIMEFENQSDSDANLVTFRLMENRQAEEVFQNFQPGSTELPEGTMKHYLSPYIESGSKNSNLKTKFYEGTYAVLCVKTKTQEYYFGDLITITR